MMIRMEKSKSLSYALDDKSIVAPKKKQKPTLSESEMEAARQLIELSNGDSCSGHRSLTAVDFNDVVEDNNSSNSCSVQGRPQEEQQQQKSKFDDVDVSSNVDTMNDNESKEEIRTKPRRRRKNKRYRFVLDLYRVTEPVISR